MGSDVVVGVVGATGALGGEILAVLDKAPWRPDEVVALARASTSTGHVTYGEEQLVVDDAAHQVFDELDLVLLAVPASEARPVGERAVEAGVPLVDASGVFLADGDVPLVVPWVNPEALGMAQRQVVAVPSLSGLLLGSLLGPLHRAGFGGRASATVLMPASSQGREGIDELSRQVVALFNSATPPRKVFPTGLAFDLLPQVGDTDASGWSQVERRAAAEAQVLSGWPTPVSVTSVGVPLFSGVGATVELVLDRSVPAEMVHKVLVDGGLRAAEDPGPRALPRPRKVEGHPFVHFGRLRQGEDGALHLWLAMDNLRAAATVMVAAGAALLGDRLSADAPEAG